MLRATCVLADRDVPGNIPPDRYGAALAAFVPFPEPDHVTRLRKRLMAARDYATRGLSNSEAHTVEAVSLFRVILDVSSAYVFRVYDRDCFEQAADVCLRLLSTASTLDAMGGCNDAARH